MKFKLVRLIAMLLLACMLFSGCASVPAESAKQTTAGYTEPTVETPSELPTVPYFGMYGGGAQGELYGYAWDEEKGAFVTKAETDGNAAYYGDDGAILSVDYSFFANVSFVELIEGGGFFLTARTAEDQWIRYGVSVNKDLTLDIFSDFADGGEAINRIVHKSKESYPVEGGIELGVIVNGNSMLMLWNDTLLYRRSLQGISKSELVVCGAQKMAAELRNIRAENDSAAVDLHYLRVTENYLDPLVGRIEGQDAGYSKCTENRKAGTVQLLQKSQKSNSPLIAFYHNGNELYGNAWAISGTINTRSTSQSGQLRYICHQNDKNYACIYINRRAATATGEGSNGIWQHIVENGIKTPASANTHVSEDLVDSTDWTAEFVFLYCNGVIDLYLKEPGEEMKLMTRYTTKWEKTYARFEVIKYADAIFSDLKITSDEEEVIRMQAQLCGIPENPIASARVLFIGNSATSVNALPGLLSRLARQAGYNVEANSITKGGATLAQHADTTTAHGKSVLNEIQKGYDIVFIQDNGNCITSASTRQQTKNAAKALHKAITQSGAQTYLYVRPPYGYTSYGYDPLGQCREFDLLFGEIAEELPAKNAYVNRAFAYAMQNTQYPLWGSDNAHTSEYGGYLAVCVFFCTLFQTSSTVLDANGLPEQDARVLQEIADKIVLEGVMPW